MVPRTPPSGELLIPDELVYRYNIEYLIPDIISSEFRGIVEPSLQSSLGINNQYYTASEIQKKEARHQRTTPKRHGK